MNQNEQMVYTFLSDYAERSKWITNHVSAYEKVYFMHPSLQLLIGMAGYFYEHGSCFRVLLDFSPFSYGFTIHPGYGVDSSTGLSVSGYASLRQLPDIPDENRNSITGECKRYTKAQLKKHLQCNINCLEEHFLPEVMSYTSLEDYFQFLLELDDSHYRIRIPSPSIEGFYLSFQLNKLTEAASSILLLYKKNPYTYYYKFEKIIDPEGDFVSSELNRIESLKMNRWDINDRQTEFLVQVINEKRSELMKELDMRLLRSKEACQQLFESAAANN